MNAHRSALSSTIRTQGMREAPGGHRNTAWVDWTYDVAQKDRVTSEVSQWVLECGHSKLTTISRFLRRPSGLSVPSGLFIVGQSVSPSPKALTWESFAPRQP